MTCPTERKADFGTVRLSIYPENVSFVDSYVDNLQIPSGRDNTNLSLSGIEERNLMIMEKLVNTATQGHTFTKKIGQTVYVVRYHFNECCERNHAREDRPNVENRGKQGSCLRNGVSI